MVAAERGKSRDAPIAFGTSTKRGGAVSISGARGREETQSNHLLAQTHFDDAGDGQALDKIGQAHLVPLAAVVFSRRAVETCLGRNRRPLIKPRNLVSRMKPR